MSQSVLDGASLTALRCLEATMRLGSMSAAADELHLTHGAVSRQIRNLERLLGRPLFERRGRRIVPTPTAEPLTRDVADALARLRETLETARSGSATETVVLSCEPTLLIRWLIPRMHIFRDAAPDVEVRLMAAGGPVRFRRDDIDLAIRRNDFPRDPTVTARPLMPEHTGPVCRPDVAAQLARPSDLRGHRLLHSRTRPDAWQRWAGLAGISVADEAQEAFEHFYIALEAAIADLGVAIASHVTVLDAIRHDQLAAPFGFTPDGSHYELLSPSATEPGTPSEALGDWLMSIAGEFGALEPS